MGSKGYWGGGGGGRMRGFGGGGEAHLIWVDLPPPPHTPDEISWFRAWGGGAIHFTGMHKNRLPNGGPGSGVTLYQLGD